MLLTPRQLAAFWRLWSRAESESMPHGADKEARETFRRAVISRACNKRSLRAVSPTGDYDRLMYEVASLASDYQAMSYWCIAAERRTAHLIGECARQIGEIAGVPRGWEYCRSLFEQAHFPPHWEDIPQHLLDSSFQMLDTHRRRLLRRDHGWRGAEFGEPLGFVPDRVYAFAHRDQRPDRPICNASASPQKLPN
jgi:hypothetical protein